MPILWLALLTPVALVALLLAMERVERGLEDQPSRRSDEL